MGNRSAITLIAAGMFLGLGLIAGPVSAGDKLAVSKRDCQRLVRHLPAPDVAYQPGVDVHGRKVVGADLNPRPPIRVPKEIVIDIGVDIAEKYDLGAKGTGYSAATQTVSKVSVDPLSGAVKIDGQALDQTDRAALAEACRKTYGRK